MGKVSCIALFKDRNSSEKTEWSEKDVYLFICFYIVQNSNMKKKHFLFSTIFIPLNKRNFYSMLSVLLNWIVWWSDEGRFYNVVI